MTVQSPHYDTMAKKYMAVGDDIMDNMRRTRYQLYMLSSCVVAGGLGSLAFPAQFALFWESNQTVAKLVGVSAIAIGVAGMQLIYLRGGAEATIDNSLVNRLARVRDNLIEARLQELSDLLGEIKSQVASGGNVNLELSAEERAGVIESFSTGINHHVGAQLVSAIEAKAKEAALNESTRDVRSAFQYTIDRLRAETSALGRRGNVNLVIGSVATSMALAILAYMVLSTNSSFSNTTALLSHYIPRLALVLFAEVFAFFFLRLYKASLSEIKYFQNELTNVEMKAVALDVALLRNDTGSVQGIGQMLAQTERNFVLRNGETTVELERHKLETERSLGALEKSSQLLNMIRQKGQS